jgi:3-(3-hydroxy-phenyl)propionate hydroxylase
MAATTQKKTAGVASHAPIIPQAQAALPSHVDVVIVGFGPAGAALANLLGRYGVATLVVDKAEDVLPMPRAISLDNEALRILQMVGLAEDAFEKIAIPQVRLHSPYAGEFGRVNTAGCLDGHPKLITFYQPEMEHALRSALKQYPTVHTASSVEMTDFVDLGHEVKLQLTPVDGEAQTVTCRYLVAADGAGSPIRTRLGLEFGGETYAQDWLIVDAKYVRSPISDIEFTCDPERPVPHMTAPGGRERWEFMMKPGETREQVLHPDFLRELLKPWAKPEELEIERTAVYRFHARVADTFRKGNVFLVGDAAHITPPFVGQGLCAGLRDVANLGWKLAWVLNGHADARILDSYDQERRPHAKAMIDLARAMGLLIKPVNPLAAALSSQLMKNLRRLPPIRTLFDDLKIKPKNRFKAGLFRSRNLHARFDRGNHLSQVLLRRLDGSTCLSDEALNDRLTLIGFGIDPTTVLSADSLDAWRAAGGAFVHLAHRGQKPAQPAADLSCWEDLTGELVPNMAPVGWLVAVRPDRVIMHDCPAAQADTLVRETLTLLQK